MNVLPDSLRALVTSNEERERREADEAARIAREALAKFDRDPTELKQLRTKIATAQAKVAKLKADTADATLALCELQNTDGSLSWNHGRELKKLRHASMPAWRLSIAHGRLRDALDKFREDRANAPVGEVSLVLGKALQYVSTLQSGDADPPSDGSIEAYVDKAFVDFNTALVAAKAAHAQQRDERERQERARRVLS